MPEREAGVNSRLLYAARSASSSAANSLQSFCAVIRVMSAKVSGRASQRTNTHRQFKNSNTGIMSSVITSVSSLLYI